MNMEITQIVIKFQSGQYKTHFSIYALEVDSHNLTSINNTNI
jgi:hypothetical protein